MGIVNKLILCPNEKDTKKLMQLLELMDNPFIVVNGTITTKRNVNLHYKDVLGMKILDDVNIPFYHASEHQQDNMDLYYVESYYDAKDITEERLQEEIRNAKPWFSEEKELFINKNSTILWVTGERATLKTGLSLLMIDRVAEKEIGELSNDLENLKDFLTDDKIDMSKALPYFMEKVAKEKLEEDVIKLLNSVIIIDLDGIEDADNYFSNSGLFKIKKFKK